MGYTHENSHGNLEMMGFLIGISISRGSFSGSMFVLGGFFV